eukprot:COSAG06_NODE_41295_length_393_cov_0.489796_1_plen_26_part_10
MAAAGAPRRATRNARTYLAICIGTRA